MEKAPGQPKIASQKYEVKIRHEYLFTLIENPSKDIGGNIGINKPGTDGHKPAFMRNDVSTPINHQLPTGSNHENSQLP